MDNDVKKYLEAKQLMASLEEKVAKYRQRILEQMHEMGQTKFETPQFKVQLRMMTTEHVSKKDIPPDVWVRYAKPSTIEQLVVTDSTKPRRRSPSR
jgi:hypothetical protein